MAIFILIPGAWHSAACWTPLRLLLETKGHCVIAHELPGMGFDRTLFSNTSFEDWTRSVADVAQRQTEPVILVGHSRGGMIVSQVAELIPNNVRAAVYLSALLMPARMTTFEFLHSLNHDMKLDFKIAMSEDGLATTVEPQSFAKVGYQLTPPEALAVALSALTPEPLFIQMAQLSLSEDRYFRVPRIFIESTEDRVVPLTIQRKMQAHISCERVFTLASDHSAFVSMPEKLAAILDSLAA